MNDPSTTPGKTPPASAMATVTACRYDFGAGQALAFGIPKSKHFLISFNYWANGELHSGEFASAKALPQGHLFPITYDPDAPHEHSHSMSAAGPRRGWIVLALVWIVVLFVIWLVRAHSGAN